jgi:hypothetical protein
MDIKTAFLNARTNIDIYVKLPPKWKVTDFKGISDNKVALLL